jgi:hypothetical protein
MGDYGDLDSRESIMANNTEIGFLDYAKKTACYVRSNGRPPDDAVLGRKINTALEFNFIIGSTCVPGNGLSADPRTTSRDYFQRPTS